MHGADRVGWAVLRRKLKRSEMARFFSEPSPCLVGIEASGSGRAPPPTPPVASDTNPGLTKIP